MRTRSLRLAPVRSSRAFTLVEMLVAEAVLLILLIIVTQLIFGLVQTAGQQKKRIDSLDDARQSLDRLSLDWSSRVRRGDVPGFFTKATSPATDPNDQLAFLTQVQAYSGTRRLAWVSYQVNPISQVIMGGLMGSTSGLERGIIGYNWNSGEGTPTLAFPVSTPTPAYEPLANTVFRLEYCFLQRVPAGASGTSPYVVSNTSLNLNSTNVAGVVVAVAAIDQQSRQILTQAQLASLAQALPKVSDGQDPQSLWTGNINSGTFTAAATAAGIPKSAINAVRVFQRIFYLQE